MKKKTLINYKFKIDNSIDHRDIRSVVKVMKSGVLSGFVASNNECPEDKGFAIKGWTKVRFENADIILKDETALAMGNYFFTDSNGDEVKAEYTFGYISDDNGDLRIQLHHSSMPATTD